MDQLSNRMFWAIIALALQSSSVSAALQLQRPAYVVTSDPISVHPGPGGLCVAIAPADPTGIWWWGPGRSGCASRNTLPGPHQEDAKGLAALFHATDAAVSRDGSETFTAHFRLSMHGPPAFVDVDLTVGKDSMHCLSTGATVGTIRTAVLEIPFLPPR